jgi:hypothetical protein
MEKIVISLLAFSLVISPVALASNPKLSESQRKELTLFSMKAMGLKVSISDVKKALPANEVNELIATGINLNDHLCAKVLEVRPLKMKSRYEVKCTSYRGGTSTKHYIIDALNGVAFVP